MRIDTIQVWFPRKEGHTYFIYGAEIIKYLYSFPLNESLSITMASRFREYYASLAKYLIWSI